MAETIVLSTNFCCRCRESSLIERLGELIDQAVSCFEQTERAILTSQLWRSFQAWHRFSSKSDGNAPFNDLNRCILYHLKELSGLPAAEADKGKQTVSKAKIAEDWN